MSNDNNNKFTGEGNLTANKHKMLKPVSNEEHQDPNEIPF